ncbi:MAG: hypothetical protein AAFW47_01550 [Pseudomonadota bacterium]
MTDKQTDDREWSISPSMMQKLRIAGIVLLVLVTLADLFAKHKAYFGLDGTIFFNAIYAFLCSAALVFIARAIGMVLKRRETYYDG